MKLPLEVSHKKSGSRLTVLGFDNALVFAVCVEHDTLDLCRVSISELKALSETEYEEYRGRGSGLLSAAMSLVGRLKIIHGLPEYKAVWETAQAQLGPYKGPQYDKELETLEAAILAEHKRIFPEEFCPEKS